MGLLTPCSVPRGGFLYTMIVPGGGFLLSSSHVRRVCPGGMVLDEIDTCIINSPCTFTCYLDLSNFIVEPGVSYFRVLTICFVSAVGCHCFDLLVLFWQGGGSKNLQR